MGVRSDKENVVFQGDFTNKGIKYGTKVEFFFLPCISAGMEMRNEDKEEKE